MAGNFSRETNGKYFALVEEHCEKMKLKRKKKEEKEDERLTTTEIYTRSIVGSVRCV